MEIMLFSVPFFFTELGGIALIIDHELSDQLPAGNFPAKPFFGVKPVIVDPKLVLYQN